MDISLQNECVVVTGGARRIGRAIALECARAGASVAITYNASQDEAETTLALLRERNTHSSQQFAAFQCDLSRSGQIEEFVEQARKFFMPTALINNAAIFRRTPFAETSTPAWERAFDDHIAANLKAPYLLSKHFGEIFWQQGRGAILNVADIFGSRPLKNYTSYCISKAGVLMLTECLAKALAPRVRVNCICPGTILLPSEPQNGAEDGKNDDGATQDEAALISSIPAGRLGTPEEIAQVAVFLLGGPTFISGVALPVDGAQRLK